ncbi:MAG: hypothetical protein H7X95_09910 [Deltaproteobacteria bacterium]|nr:hypothetical protein [Deltaproteobacteria bacterium]
MLLWGLGALLIASPVIGAAYPAVMRIPRRQSSPAGPTSSPVPSPSTSRSLPQALFSHRTHGNFQCFACHPGTFPQEPLAFTHEDMNRGRFCGRCHDGGIAFAVTGTACGGCHVPSR